MEKSRFASLTVEAFNIVLACTPSCLNVAFPSAASQIARTGPAPGFREGVETWLAPVALITHHARFTAALAIAVALRAEGANWVAAAGQTSLLTPQAIETVPAPFAVGTTGVIRAARAVAPMAR